MSDPTNSYPCDGLCMQRSIVDVNSHECALRGCVYERFRNSAEFGPPAPQPKPKRRKSASHAGCYSFPNCDDAPMGCIVEMGDAAESYGHRG